MFGLLLVVIILISFLWTNVGKLVFLFGALSTCWVIYSLLFSRVLLFIFATLRRALFCYCSCAFFLGCFVN